MAIDTSELAAAGWAFDLDDAAELSSALAAFLTIRPRSPEVLGVGEPTHGDPAFLSVRNRAFTALVERGFRSIAIESDAVAALTVNAYVHDSGHDLDITMADGFSHGFDRLDANRELVTWMRAYNQTQTSDMTLAFYGFDGPFEMTYAASPRRYLEQLHTYLTSNLGAESVLDQRDALDRLLGDDQRWSNPAAQMDAAQSVGASPEATALRAVANDLLTALHAYAPDLVARSSLDDWHRAEVHGRAALGLLRYHAVAACQAPAAERTSRMLGVRDALMADNLLAIRAREQHRGPTLAFGHNRHLQRHPSTWRLADMDLHWSSAGGIIATLLGNRYTFITGSLGARTSLPVPTPAGDTFEGALQSAMLDRCGLFDGNRLRSVERLKDLRSRTDVGPNQGYFPLDAETLDHCDAVIHLTPALSLTQSASSAVEDLTGEICALPDVECLEATAENGAPESNWGNRFFYVGPDRMRPFATIVIRDMRGFDEDSNLDRASVFRLNIDLGRDEFQRQFGYPPAKFADHRPGIDFTQLDILTPHPMYGRQAWASIINPNPRRQDIDQLISQAHGRAQQRENRRQHRQSAARGRAR
jgi:erythromycin esterase-like protein